MPTVYDANLAANLILDDAGEIRGITHVDRYPEMEQADGHEATAAYVRDIANRLNIGEETLHDLDRRVSYRDPKQQDIAFRFSEAKASFDTVTYAYYQTYLNTPVWESGITATIKQLPTRILSATNTSHRGIDAEMPSRAAIDRYQLLFATGEKDAAGRRAKINATAAAATSDLLDKILGDENRVVDVKGIRSTRD